MTKRFESCSKYSRWHQLVIDREEAIRHNDYRSNLGIVADKITVEKVDEPNLDTYKFSNEVPTNKSFYDMGLCTYENAHLDEGGQTGRYLREYCVQRAGANHFLHLRNITDIKSKAEHHDPEKLAVIFTKIAAREEGVDPAELDYDVAYQWAEANKSLEVDRKRFLAMVHREMKQLTHPERMTYIDHLMLYSEEAEEVTMRWVNYLNARDVERDELIQEMNDLNDYYQRRDEQWVPEDEESPEYWAEILEPSPAKRDQMDRKQSTNPYSSNRLFNGNEALTWEFQTLIDNADIRTIRRLQSKMFPQRRSQAEIDEIVTYFEQHYGTTPKLKTSNPRMKTLWKKGKPVYDDEGYPVMVPAVTTGLRYKRPEFHYFTPAMVSHFWRLIKLRKQELNKVTIPEEDLSLDAMTAVSWIHKLGKGQVTCTIIQNAIEGKSTNAYGIKVEFSHPLSREEANTVWQTYKQL
jgi:hypothetical protein